ncbi:MAG: nucleoside hydrolase [Candidatus Helarchaeota archaeon]
MRKIIFDGDPGIDDALAIILACQSNELQLLGITTVAGNVDVDKGTKNALSILEYLNRPEIPVAKGSKKPLYRDLQTSEHIHGEDGLGNVNLPPPNSKSVSIPASEFIYQTVKNHSKQVTIVATGPLTNLSIVLKSYPDFSELISEIVIMGGSVKVPGNVTPYAEFNIWADAEAAKIVLESGLPITLVPLDVTMSFVLSTLDVEKIKEANTKISKLVTRILPFYIEAHKKRSNIDGCFIHDALAMAFTIDQTLLETDKIGIEVIIDKNKYYGQTKPSTSKPLIDLSMKVDSQKFLSIFIERMIKI